MVGITIIVIRGIPISIYRSVLIGSIAAGILCSGKETELHSPEIFNSDTICTFPSASANYTGSVIGDFFI
jgi:hypothetical protein